MRAGTFHRFRKTARQAAFLTFLDAPPSPRGPLPLFHQALPPPRSDEADVQGENGQHDHALEIVGTSRQRPVQIVPRRSSSFMFDSISGRQRAIILNSGSLRRSCSDSAGSPFFGIAFENALGIGNRIRAAEKTPAMAVGRRWPFRRRLAGRTVRATGSRPKRGRVRQRQ